METSIFGSSGQSPLPPKGPHASSHDFSEPSEGQTHHHRSSSDSFLIEQPSWLEELLDEPDTPPLRAPRRSSSYSTFLDVVADSRKDVNVVPVSQPSIRTPNSRKAGGSTASKGIVKHNQQENECSGKRDGSNANPPTSKADVKLAKQQYAQRSRLRKLQYIATLERNVQILQAEGSQASAALEYLDQRVLILGMENQALRQRLDGLSREQQIKHLEKDMLERELARLKFVYHHQQQQQQYQQKQQQKQQQHQKQNHSSQDVQSKSREVELQMASLSI